MRILAAALSLCLATAAAGDTVARVLGKPVTRLDAPDGGALFRVVLRALLDDFARTEKIAATDEEVAAFVAKMNVPPSAGAADGARMLIRGYKIDQALYARYGGRLAVSTLGLQPIDAYARILRDAEERRAFQILDKSFEPELRRHASFAGTRNFVDGKTAQEMMSRAWWLGEPPDEQPRPKSDWLQVTTKGATLSSTEAGFTLDAPPDGNWIEITRDIGPDRRWMVWVSNDRTRSYSVIVVRDAAKTSTDAFARAHVAAVTRDAARNGSTVTNAQFAPAADAVRYTHTMTKKGRPTLYTFGYVTGGAVKLVIQTETTESSEPEAFKAFLRRLSRP